MNAPTASREARWFWIPGLFGILLFLSLLLRWLPAAIIRSHEPFGMVQVLMGDAILAWKSFLRCATAYVLTALAFDYLVPIRWKTAIVIAVGAVVAEIAIEFSLSVPFGARAGVGIQLVGSALAYTLTLAVSLAILNRSARRSHE